MEALQKAPEPTRRHGAAAAHAESSPPTARAGMRRASTRRVGPPAVTLDYSQCRGHNRLV
jgi:hypothetical protein